MRLGQPLNYLKTLGPLPTLNPKYIDSLEISPQDFRSTDILKLKLFPGYFPVDLIDQNADQEVLVVKEKIGTVEKLPQLTKQERMSQRCKKCNYIVGDHGYYQCHRCKDAYHDNQSCISEVVAPHIDSETWVCPNCKACELCFSKKINDEDMVPL